ncbi:MAG: tetratricopeptide repeat protein [Bacteroidia bacterium]
MKKRNLFAIGLSIIGTGIFAQTLQEAIKKTDNERFAAAADDFRALIAKDPAKGDYYYYFGENYFKKNDLDSAMIQYKKGTEVQATNALNYVGIGKVLLFQEKEADANTNFFKAKTLGNGKNATVLMKLGEAFTIAPKLKNLAEAVKLLNEAIKLEPKNPEGYILLGDALLEQNPADGSPAIKNYDKAATLDPKSVKAILREGKLYQRGKNYQLALDLYKKAEGIDPTFAPAYREKAELYHLAGQDAKAVESYKKYLELNNSPEAHERYGSFLFVNKQYKEAIGEIEGVQQRDTSSDYLYRVLADAYYELGDKVDPEAYKKGLKASDAFFRRTAGKNFKYVADDYKYHGLLMAKTGSDSLGIVEIEKAIALDPTANCELNGEIGKIHKKAKRYEKAIAAYDKKALCSKGLGAQDYFEIGQAYFFLGGAKEKEAMETKDAATKSKKEAESKEFFVKADSAFYKLTQASPTFATGYFWRGKSNIHLDLKDERGAAKEHYEKALSLIKPEERNLPANKNNVLEACLYLGSHYAFSKTEKDLVKAKEYFTIVKELDPNNKAQKDFFASPAGKQ